MSQSRRIAILGSTGSIGSQTLEVISSQPGLRACALAAGGNWELLARQVRESGAEIAAIADPAAGAPLRAELARLGGSEAPPVRVLAGPEAMTEMVRTCGCDVLLSGIVGSAGLAPTLAAIDRGADLAIANKETLVMAGAIVMPRARQAGVRVLPVDSEHSAIFQCLQAGKRSEVRRVVITASGGALRDLSADDAANATVADALNHPTWQMGRKITIDSATLINKALEIVEAHWLFDLSAEQIEVVVHPESIIHSCVEFCDGSMVAQMGRPDMTLPIAYALGWPDRPVRAMPPLDLAAVGKLTFRPLGERFARGVELGFAVIRRGGLAGAVLNAANEAAVQAFLDQKIRFGQIVPLVENIVNQTPAAEEVSVASLLSADQWARRQVAAAVDAPPADKAAAAKGPTPARDRP